MREKEQFLKDGKGKIITENSVNTNDYEKYYEEEVLDNNVYVLDENLKRGGKY